MEKEIIYGIRGPEFQALIRSILIKAKLKPHYLDLLLDTESMIIYDKAFTSSTANPKENYEVFEQLGDVLLGSFITWYCYRRFPQLMKPEGVKIVARLRMNYVGEEMLSELANSMNFGSYITSERFSGKKDRNEDEMWLKTLEDVFEAFIGATSYIIDLRIKQGIGYPIVYDILSSIYDTLPISLDYSNLFDSVTRLKELYDSNPQLGNKVLYYENYLEGERRTEVFVNRYENGKRVVIGHGKAKTKMKAKKIAAEQAIKYLNSKGFVRKTGKYDLYF